MGWVLGFALLRCTDQPPHGGGDAGEAGAGGVAAQGGSIAGSGGLHSGAGGTAPAAGDGGAPPGQGGATSGDGGSNAGESNAGGHDEAGAGQGGADEGQGGSLTGAGGVVDGQGGSLAGIGAASGEAGAPATAGGSGAANGGATAGEGGAPNSGHGGVSAGEGGRGEGGDAGDDTSFGGEGGSPEGPCTTLDLLPEVGFNPFWSESTICTPFIPGVVCPTTFGPIIVNGRASFSSWARPGGAAWSQTISTMVTIPEDAMTVTMPSLPVPWCPTVGALPGLYLGFADRTAFPREVIPVTNFRGQLVRFSITFSQTSGAPCYADIDDVALEVQLCPPG
jgi:hypothetical protein